MKLPVTEAGGAMSRESSIDQRPANKTMCSIQVTISLVISWVSTWKNLFRGLRTRKAQICLWHPAVWSAPLLFVYNNWKVSCLDLLRAKFHFSSLSLLLSRWVWISLCWIRQRQGFSRHSPFVIMQIVLEYIKTTSPTWPEWPKLASLAQKTCPLYTYSSSVWSLLPKDNLFQNII